MSNSNDYEQRAAEALSSADGAARATPRPFLFTRLEAKMRRADETGWEKAGRFITKPAVAIAGLCIVMAINILVVLMNDTPKTVVTEEQTAVTDNFSNSVAVLYDIDNNEP